MNNFRVISNKYIHIIFQRASVYCYIPETVTACRRCACG